MCILHIIIYKLIGTAVFPSSILLECPKTRNLFPDGYCFRNKNLKILLLLGATVTYFFMYFIL